MPYLTNDNIFYYKSAYDMDQKNILKLISVDTKARRSGDINYTLYEEYG